MDSITRRSFIKTSAVGAGAAASVLVGTSKTAWAGANDRVRVAVVGINGRGRSHLGAYRNCIATVWGIGYKFDPEGK